MNTKLLKAINFAFEKHEGQYRKKTTIPYIIHPLGAMINLLKEQGEDNSIDDNVVVSGVLHDIYEDTDTSLEEIKKEFGEKVAELVEIASEPEELKKSEDENWRERKEKTISNIKNADRQAKIMICADKCDNLLSMNEDLFLEKDLWGKFNASKEEIKWYYKNCIKAFTEGESIADTRVFKILKKEFEMLFG
jgi:(p)ppGpp synthase/HD superfamily hydrolase